MLDAPGSGAGLAVAEGAEFYEARFDGGHRFRLFDREGTFHVSRAGLALGNHLLRNLTETDLAGRILDIGTGSGVLALLLRRMGARSVAATDICGSAVSTARLNELVNFEDSRIDFSQGDLFPCCRTGLHQQFDLIVFNPPGWRTPSDLLSAELRGKRRSLDLEAMFFGDRVLLSFLGQLSRHLTPNGRAVVGFNSLVGVADIFERARSMGADHVLGARVLERLEFPLFLYTAEWGEVRNSLLAEFARGREEYAASYETRGETIHWFYEITEVTTQGVSTRLGASGREGTSARG